MEFFKSTRQKIGNSVLEKRALKVKRKISYSGIDRLKKIGIIWDAARSSDFVMLSKFHQRMKERNADVNILGYYPGKELPDQYTAIRYLTCIRRNELNFFYLPVSKEAGTFIGTKFDVLIDINFDKVFPLNYISTLSEANLKVGLFRKESDSGIYDLMMDIKKPVLLENYLNEVVHYLEMIKAGAPAQVVNQ